MDIQFEWTDVSEGNIEIERVTIRSSKMDTESPPILDARVEGLLSFESYGIYKNFDKLDHGNWKIIIDEAATDFATKLNVNTDYC